MVEILRSVEKAWDPDCMQRQRSSSISIRSSSLASKLFGSEKGKALGKALQTCKQLKVKFGIYSATEMIGAGFQYTGEGAKACCPLCKLEVSEWTMDMKPFDVHSQRRPNCEFVRSMKPEAIIFGSPMTNSSSSITQQMDVEKPLKRQKIEEKPAVSKVMRLTEVDAVKQGRKRTFDIWPHRVSPSSAQMIEAGFFNCNVGDRVICLYCGLICQQWTPYTDDPCEIHKQLSPNCPYVIAMVTRQQQSTIRIVNEQLTRDNSDTSRTNDDFHCSAIVYTAACHSNYIDIPRRHASFSTWPNTNLPPVDDLVRAGYFYTGTQTIVTCFYCGGSLQNWGATDNPTIEHARWFPNCAYAKQLCGPELYRKIQVSKRAQQEKATGSEPNRRVEILNGSTRKGQLNIPDESTLSRLVAARLDLPISQNMLDRNFKLSVIKRCWEDQLKLKRDDFHDEYDLFLACLILLKQIEKIDGKKENIIIPSAAMAKLREREQAETATREQAANTTTIMNSSNERNAEMLISSESVAAAGDSKEQTIENHKKQNMKIESNKSSAVVQKTSTSETQVCVLCLEEERRLACLPCGHLATCVPCGHSLRSCPICRAAIDGFVRIFI